VRLKVVALYFSVSFPFHSQSNDIYDIPHTIFYMMMIVIALMIYVCLFLSIAPSTAAAETSLDGSTYMLKNQVLNKFLAVVEVHDHDDCQYRLSLTSDLPTDMSYVQWKFVPSPHHHGYYQIQHVNTGLSLDVSIHNYNLINLTATSPLTTSSSSSEKNTQLWQPIYCDDSRISFKLINKYLHHTTQRSIYLTSCIPSSQNDDDCNANIENVIYNSSNDHNLHSIWSLQANRDAAPHTGLFSQSSGKCMYKDNHYISS